jgi:hypothetical protein
MRGMDVGSGVGLVNWNMAAVRCDVIVERPFGVAFGSGTSLQEQRYLCIQSMHDISKRAITCAQATILSWITTKRANKRASKYRADLRLLLHTFTSWIHEGVSVNSWPPNSTLHILRQTELSHHTARHQGSYEGRAMIAASSSKRPNQPRPFVRSLIQRANKVLMLGPVEPVRSGAYLMPVWVNVGWGGYGVLNVSCLLDVRKSARHVVLHTPTLAPSCPSNGQLKFRTTQL